MTLTDAIARMDECAAGGDIGEPFYADREAWVVIRAALPVWRPIETAPQDGREIMTPDGAMFYQGQENYWGQVGWHPESVRDSTTWYSERPMYPTHWMPLPQPPEAK